MVNIFTKEKFKRHIHKNCHRNWFSKNSNNVRYKNRQGTRDVNSYDDKYTIRIKNVLEDPGIINDRKISELPAPGTGHGLAGLSGVVGGLLAVPTGGVSLITGAIYAGIFEMGEQTYSEMRSRMISMPQDVNFTITSDESEWIDEEVPVDGVRQLALNICEWSNQVYKERYEQKRSDNYEFQTYIEQRPPTPNY